MKFSYIPNEPLIKNYRYLCHVKQAFVLLIHLWLCDYFYSNKANGYDQKQKESIGG